MKCSEALRILLRDGWFVVSQRGSHLKLRHAEKRGPVVFLNHGSKELSYGLQKRLFKAAGIENQQ